MTTETASEEAPDPYADAQCSNCQAPVKRRRPSLTGQHFCPKKKCQQAKHRFYHRRRADGAADLESKLKKTHQKQLANFVGAVAHAERYDCGTCGRAGAIPRYSHPSPDWSRACNPPDKLPISGDPLLTEQILLMVYPR